MQPAVSQVQNYRCRCHRPISLGIYIPNKDHLCDRLSVPLKDLKFKVDIKDCLSTVEITQVYINNNNSLVETQYVFPIDQETTAITGLTITIDDKVIESKVMKKEKAKEKYNDTLATGNNAFMMNQDEKQPDIIKVSIGKLPPNKEVTVVTTYVRLLDIENGNWSFRIPLTYTPRFDPGTTDTTPVVKHEPEYLVRERRTIPHTAPHHTGSTGPKPGFLRGTSLPYKWHFNATINSSKPIAKLSSPSHIISTEFGDSHKKAVISLQDEKEIPDKDLIILYKTQDFEIPSVIIQKLPKNDCYAALLSFYPTFGEKKDKKGSEDIDMEVKGEYIFLLDCSGSMKGERISLAKSALSTFLRSLPPNSKFNVVCFGDNYKCFKATAVPYNKVTMHDAIKFIGSITANMGGTRIVKALTSIVNVPTEPSYPRTIFMLTDGAVTNSDDVINLIKNHAHDSRVHTFGIGSGASRYLVKGSAIAGNGSFQFAVEGEDLTPKVVQSLSRATVPACTGSTIIWPEDIQIVLQSPPNNKSFNVYMNEPFIVLALIKGKIGGQTVSLLYEESNTGKEITMEVTLPETLTVGHDIYQAAVKSAFEKNTELKDSEIIDLSIKYSVLSSLTAFIAIQKTQGKLTGAVRPVKIPIAITRDTQQSVARSKPSGHPLKSAPKTATSRCREAPMAFNKAEAESSRTIKMSKGKKGTMTIGSTVAKPMLAKREVSKLSCPSLEDHEEIKEKYVQNIKPYERVIETQDIYGNWNWEKDAFKAIGIKEEEAKKNIPEELQAIVNNEESLLNMWITIIALAKLETKCADSKSSWQLIFKKAVSWLKKGGVEYENFKKFAVNLIH